MGSVSLVGIALAPMTAAERTMGPQPAAPLYWQTSVGPLAFELLCSHFRRRQFGQLHGAGLCDLVPDHGAAARGIHAKLERQLQTACSMQ